jgi:peptidoglycan-N-acetylglucosamine deacetylase
MRSTCPALFSLIVVSLACLALPRLAMATGPYSWPGQAEGAVSLTFDDGMPSQLERAVPTLDRLGLKATFYVNPGYSIDWEKNAPRWRQLASNAHELGNHTDKHPCSCQSDFRHGGPYCLEKLDLSEVTRAIDDAERALAELTSQPASARSFAYPCYNSDVGVGLRRVSYIPEVAKRYPAARAGVGRDNDPATVDLAYIYAFVADEQTADQMIAHIESALRRGRWAVLVFHGIGAEWNQVQVAEFDRVMTYLSDNRSRIWVAPVTQVAAHIRSQQSQDHGK